MAWWRIFTRAAMDPAAREAEAAAQRETARTAAVAEMERREAAEWAMRVALAHEAIVEQIARSGTDEAGFRSAGTIPVINVSAGEWVDLFGRVRHPSHLSRWLGRE